MKDLRSDIWNWSTFSNIKEVLHALLSLLKKHNVTATFFISGVCAQQNRDEILRIKDAGHEIGLHGYRHVPYDMSYVEMMTDMYQAISVFKEIGVATRGFRAPWLITNENAYHAAQKLDLRYVSNTKAKNGLQNFDKYNFVELPIYLDDQMLLQENAVKNLLKASQPGRVFEFHLLYVRRRIPLLDDFLNKLRIETATLSQIAEGTRGLGLSFDIAYLNRLELLKKLFH